ncbi:hypothetical protein [Amycolatopsis kentuckyensis]|uniref:hypothetical protein n=1 Tax=Amycolatopsis kentuckyensis TaxID=218823 RepID=UPI00356525D6
MTDLDELRRVLRDRESLAPDPGAVLAGATRRIRRRRATSVAAVTLTVAALGAGAVALLDRGAPAATPPATLASPASSAAASEAPDAAKVPPAAPAISLEDKSWELLFWAVHPHSAGLHYRQGHQYGLEIDVQDGTAPRSALPAKPTAAGQLVNPKTVTWQDGPQRWIRVRTTKPVTAAEMLGLLAKIGTTPPVLASPLKSLQVPAGQKVAAFTSEPETNTLVLCPDLEADMAPLAPGCFSLFVFLTGTGESTGAVDPKDPLPAHQSRKLGGYTLELNSSYPNKAAALALLDSVRLNR